MRISNIFKRKIKFKNISYRPQPNSKKRIENKITIRRGKLFTVAYSDLGKKIFVNQQIFRKVHNVWRSGRTKYEDPEIRLEIRERIPEYWKQEETAANMVLELKENKRKFFIKVGNSWPMEINGKIERLNFARPVQEMGLLKLISEKNFNVIPAHFGITMQGYNFIIYDYVPFITVADALEKGLISGRTYKKINKLLDGVTEEVNSTLKKEYRKYGFDKLNLTYDLKAGNTFIDVNTKQIYIFDPNSLSIDQMSAQMLDKYKIKKP